MVHRCKLNIISFAEKWQQIVLEGARKQEENKRYSRTYISSHSDCLLSFIIHFFSSANVSNPIARFIIFFIDTKSTEMNQFLQASDTGNRSSALIIAMQC